jgi:hypothetical protein
MFSIIKSYDEKFSTPPFHYSLDRGQNVGLTKYPIFSLVVEIPRPLIAQPNKHHPQRDQGGTGDFLGGMLLF